MMLSRRVFLGAGAMALTLRADPLGMPIGCQVYPVRDALGKDFDGTLRQLAGLGYRAIEMCSPPGYASGGFGPLVGMKAAEMRRKIQAAGLKCESCHYQFRELKENLDDRIAFAKELGLRQMVCSTFALRPEATMADWMKAADELNKIGEQTAKAGIQTGFHNHNFEFKEIDGVLVYDQLMGKLDPKLVKMQFQVSVISLGYEAARFLRKYPGRFLSLHLQDWSATEKKTVAIGAGMVDWKDTFAAAKTGGIRNFFVELDMDMMQASYTYLHGLKG
ncbi:Xylose isomerase domain protein TIM barrel [Candidatus Sulfopaludibacter sp. SbA4]|nr:Xylose isomerase domain protein TIM barrel [Candidatus Sulfopaludibacter sp. SbA4]